MKRTAKSLALPAAVALLALTLSACSDDGDDTDGQETTSQQTAADPTEPTEPADSATDATPGSSTDAGAVESALTAISAAEDAAGGTAYEISEEDGGWEVDVAVGDRSHEVRVGADGRVVNTDDDALDRDDREGLEAARIGIADAIEAAVATGPAGRLDDVSLERERDGHVWEVTFDDGVVDREVYVDVVTGEVVRTGVDD